MNERRRRFDKDRIILYVWMLALSIAVYVAISGTASQAKVTANQAHVTAQTAQKTARVAKVTARIAATTAQGAVTTAALTREQCERTRAIAPALAQAYAKYHILTPGELMVYKATIPASC
jgi:hypothetical protein